LAFSNKSANISRSSSEKSHCKDLHSTRNYCISHKSGKDIAWNKYFWTDKVNKQIIVSTNAL